MGSVRSAERAFERQFDLAEYVEAGASEALKPSRIQMGSMAYDGRAIDAPSRPTPL